MTPARKKFPVVLGYAVTLLLCYGLLSVPKTFRGPCFLRREGRTTNALLWDGCFELLERPTGGPALVVLFYIYNSRFETSV